jgi:polyisoprenoid-binding protein YceI
MINKLFLIAIIATLNFVAYAAVKDSVSYDVVTKKSSLKWTGRKVGGQHEGTVDLKSGYFELENNVITSGTFIMDMTSIVPTDIKGSDKKKLARHLRGEDFFNVAKYPTATLKIKETESTGKDEFDVTADMTILGVTNEITFSAKILGKSKNFIITSANITIDRTKWGITYKSSLLGNALIRDNFDMKIKLFAKKKS